MLGAISLAETDNNVIDRGETTRIMTATRREFIQTSVALAAMPAYLHPAASARRTPTNTAPNILWYEDEAKRWLEALPIGNGRIGGMVYGGKSVERIALSESTVWSGAPSTSDVNPGGREHLAEMRQLLFDEKYEEARHLCEKYLLSHSKSFGTNLPMFDLRLEIENSDEPSNYRRSLNLDDAIATVSYESNGRTFTRESFSSNPDHVLVVHLSANATGQMNCKVAFSDIKLPGVIAVSASSGNHDPDTITFRGNAFETMHSNGKQGVDVECSVRIMSSNGRRTAAGEHIEIRNADSVTLLIAIATNFAGQKPADDCAKALQSAAAKTYAQLRRAHTEDHHALFRRVQIDLGTNSHSSKMPTDQRRRAVEAGASDPELSALFFQYGRYLTIAGSRENSPLPLALQGIWNDGLASSMGWTDDFHLDINTQQNYWLAEVGNLSESQTPLFTLIDILHQSGQRTAIELYGTPGWVSHTITNPWGYTAPGGGLGWGIFVTAGVWIALQMWEHYRFSGDREFLRHRLYPVFKSAAEFFLAYMVEHPKHDCLVTGPSDSPENAFRSPSGAYCSESLMPTCDRVLVYALFSHLIEAQHLLSIDPELNSKLEAALKRLPPLQVGSHGQLQEWLEDFVEAEPNHRHTSHLIALYPENQISLEQTPQLAKAARVTLDRRINQPNWEDTEWSRANLVNYYARLRDPESAHKHLVGLISKATDDNLLTYSRGGVAGAAQNIFAVDGNTAGAAGIAEMLLQSHEEAINLLPALPAAWPDGSISGLCARGGFQVDIEWQARRLVLATIISKRGGQCKLRYEDKAILVNVPVGRRVRIPLQSFRNSEKSPAKV